MVMYAVVKTGGKQYKVSEGDVLKVELLDGEVGSSVNLDEVLALGQGSDIKVGAPKVESASVTCEIVKHGKYKKALLFKKKKRKGYTKKQGHRQNYTEVRVTRING
jgi:large subunit ribosomal protein L21